MSKLLRLVAATAVSVGVSTGFAAAQSGQITGPTGPQSVNNVTNNSDLDVSMHSTNNVGVGNFNGQLSSSGDVNASDNTTVGGVGSGNSGNSNSTMTSVTASNNSGAGAWAGLLGGAGAGQTGGITGATGPQSTNNVTNNSDVDIHNTSSNNVGVLNLSFQLSQSGNANASDNTTVGNVSSGNSGNSNTTSTTVNVSN